MSRKIRTHLIPSVRRAAAEALEDRRLFAAQLVTPLADATGVTGSSQTIDLQANFTDPKYSVVRVATTSGNVDIQTLDEEAPLNAANFLAYVDAGRYDNSIFHRPIPNFVLQGGSFYQDESEVPQFPPVVSEPNGDRSNVAGTVAFARLPAFEDLNDNGIQDPGEEIPGGGPDSATNGFFFNLVDNGANLDFQNGGFTVFGRVLGDGMTTVNSLLGVASQNVKNARINSTTVIDDVTYTVVSSNPAAVNGSIVDGNLVLAYGNVEGTADITVTATDLDGVTTVSDTLTATATFGVNLGGTSGNKSVTFVDADGTNSTVTLKGDGAASLGFDGTDLAQTVANGKVTVTGTINGVSSLAVSGSTNKTTLTINSKGGDGLTTVNTITADAAIKSITGKGTVLTGALTTSGATGAVTINSATGALITLGGTAADKGSTLSLGTLVDTSIVSATEIKSLKVASTSDTDTVADTISAPEIDAINSGGDFSNDVTVPGEGEIGKITIGGTLTGDVTAHDIGTLTVKKDVVGATITATHGADEPDNDPTVKTIKINGALTNSVIDSAGDVKSIQLGSIAGSRIVAGAPGLTDLPLIAAQLPQNALLKNLKVKTTFANSLVAARRVGTVNIKTITIDNGGTPFGISGVAIANITSNNGGGQKIKIKKADTQADVDAALANVTTSDLVIRIV